MDLNGKTALITGGARMGEAIGLYLAEKGCNVCFAYRNSKKAAADAAQKAESLGVKSLVVRGDMTRKTDIKRVVQFTLKEFGRLDILVNMASVYFETPWNKLNEEQWDTLLAANLKSAYLTVLEAAPSLTKSGGRVINIADWLCRSGRPRYKNFVPYYTAKTGVIGLTEAQALELAPHVLVNAIAPGPIIPPAGSSKALQSEVKKSTPLGRWGGALEIAKAVGFLCETDFVTGECLRVDGGRHLY